MTRTGISFKKPVVAAAILDSLEKPSRLLCTPRAYPEQLRGQYEFPGGKVEPHETAVEALHRELREELTVKVSLGAEVAPSTADIGTFAGWPILEDRTMRVWCAQLKPYESPQTGGSHLLATWVQLDELQALPWLRTNRPILERLLRMIGQGQSLG